MASSSAQAAAAPPSEVPDVDDMDHEELVQQVKAWELHELSKEKRKGAGGPAPSPPDLSATEKVELDTDHEPLVYLANQPMLSRKQARYLEFFSRFTNMKWAHIAGRTNVADPLSRNPAFSEATALFIQRLSANDPLHMREIAPDILHGYTEDLWFDNPHNTKYLSKRADGFWVGTGKSIRAASESQIVVPNGNSLKARILFAFHDTQRSGHGGIDRTFDLLHATIGGLPCDSMSLITYATVILANG
eukprot:gene22721-biopygen31377